MECQREPKEESPKGRRGPNAEPLETSEMQGRLDLPRLDTGQTDKCLLAMRHVRIYGMTSSASGDSKD